MINSLGTNSSPYLNSVLQNKRATGNLYKLPATYDSFKKPVNFELKNSDAKKTFFEKAKDWLMTPVEVQGRQRNNNQLIKETRLKHIGKTALAIACYAAFFWIIARNIRIQNKVLNNPSGKNLGHIWEDISGAPKLDELALTDGDKGLRSIAKSIVYQIKHPDEFIKKGGIGKRIILLYGPPGTGKTTFAKALAREFPDSRFASIDLSAIEDSLVGKSQGNLNSAIDTVCSCAAENPDRQFFVFFDEIDSIAAKDNGSTNQQYHSSLLNVLKKGISERLARYRNVTVIAATNSEVAEKGTGGKFIQTISGSVTDRFDIRVKVDNPTEAQLRRAIARHYSGASLVSDCLRDEDSDEVRRIAGVLGKSKASFRTLEGVYNAVASNGKPNVTFEDIMAAINARIVPTQAAVIGFR